MPARWWMPANRSLNYSMRSPKEDIDPQCAFCPRRATRFIRDATEYASCCALCEALIRERDIFGFNGLWMLARPRCNGRADH